MTKDIAKAAARYELLLENNFYAFCCEAWQYVDPCPLKPLRYIRVLCDHLQALHEQRFTHLLISAPFGLGKSTVTMVLYPAWIWLKNPSEQFLTGSHNYRDIAMRDSEKSRALIKSEWFQFHWGNKFAIRDNQDEKSFYGNNHKGFRMVFTTRSGITGKRANNIFIDDPLDIDDSSRKLERERVNHHITSGITTRLNELGRHSVIVQMQRLHINDPIGYLMKFGHWVHLNLPYEYRSSTACITPVWKDWRTKEDELLTSLHDDEWIERKKLEMGIDWEAQANQNPQQGGASIIKRDWLCFYDSSINVKFGTTFQAWDTATKTGKLNDYSCCCTVKAKYDLINKKFSIYILDVYRIKLTTPDLKEKIREKKKEFSCSIVGIEDKSSGESIIPELERGDINNMPMRINALPTPKSKEARLHAVSPLVKNGEVLFPVGEPWLEEFLDELLTFPNGDHDDQVDSFAHALNMVKCSSLLQYEALTR